LKTHPFKRLKGCVFNGDEYSYSIGLWAGWSPLALPAQAIP